MDRGTATEQQNIGERGAERPEHSESDREPRVFIIHAGEDKDSFVRPLVSALQEQGLDKDDIFFDETSIKPGEVIRDKIMSTLESDTLQLAVIVVSTSLLNKYYWPKLEFETCLRCNKRILPIWVDDNPDNFKEFSELVGKYSPTLKQLRARRVQRHSVADELTSVADEVIQELAPRDSPERKSPDPVLHVRVHLSLLQQKQIKEQVSNRILKLEEQLITVDVLKDPERLSKARQVLRKHKAFLIELGSGSVILFLKFLCQRDLDGFYHNHDKVGEGTLSHKLSSILIPGHIQDEFEGTQLIVILQVKHEDYVRVRAELGKEKAVGSQEPDIRSCAPGHTHLIPTTPLHRLIFKISQELTSKDVQTIKDKIRTDHGEGTMAPYEELTNLSDIFKQLEADNHLGSDDDEKRTNALKLLGGLENFNSRHFELDIENAGENIDFVGREEEMRNVRINTDGEDAHVKIIGINGLPGVGKTTFAHHLCLEQGRREIFISLGKVTSVDNMLSLIMREFGVTEINGDGNTEVEATVAHLIGTYDGEDCSLLLDAADSLLEVAESRRKFVGFLARVQAKQNPKVHVIVTSRASIVSGPGQGDVPAMKATIVDLEKLPDPEGTNLVKRLVGEGNITQEEAHEVCKRCKGWPLAIRIACGVMRKGRLQPSEMIKRLENLTDISDIPVIRGFLTDVVSTLERDLLATLKLVSVFAGPFTVESACVIIGQPDHLFQVWGHLRELRTRSLIKAESHSTGGFPRYDTHDVVRKFMSTLDTDAVTVQDVAAAKYRFTKLYEKRLTTVAQDMQQNMQKALATYNRDVDNFNHFLALIQEETQEDYEWRRKERHDQHTWLMDVKAEEVADRSAVHILLEQMMVVNERIAFYTGQAKRLEKQNTQAYAEMLCWLAETFLQVNQQQEAWGQLEEARRALEARPDRKDGSVQLSFARYHYVSGIYFSLRDDYKRNVRHLDQALEILSKVEIAGDHVLHARVVNSLGFAHHNHAKTMMWRGQAYLDMLQKSLEMHQKALHIITSAVGQDNHSDCATYLMNIGVVYLDMGWYYRKGAEADQLFDKALETFCDAEKLFKVMDLEKQHSCGLLQYNIARCYEALGDLDEAVSRVQRAQKVLKSIYDSHPDIADCLYFLGKLSKENKGPKMAMVYYKQSLEHNEGLGNRRNTYEWNRLKKAILASCEDQERDAYLQRFEKIDGMPYREPLTSALAGFGGRMVARLLRPMYTFVKDVWKANP